MGFNSGFKGLTSFVETLKSVFELNTSKAIAHTNLFSSVNSLHSLLRQLFEAFVGSEVKQQESVVCSVTCCL